jgi:hypothetical protein
VVERCDVGRLPFFLIWIYFRFFSKFTEISSLPSGGFFYFWTILKSKYE